MTRAYGYAATLVVCAGVLGFTLASWPSPPRGRLVPSASRAAGLGARKPAPGAVATGNGSVAAVPSGAESEDREPVAARGLPSPERAERTDGGARFEALERALERNDTTILPALRASSLDGDPELASLRIRAMGHLATAATPTERDATARTLALRLGEEMGKSSAFARGNVSLLVDALADSGSSAAVGPLAAALDSRSLPIHVETRVVEALDALGANEARPFISRFATRLDDASASHDELERELHDEAREAATRALAHLGGA